MFRQVSKVEFDAFVKNYPAPLERDVAAMFEPPLLTFNDFRRAPNWPESVVAKAVLNEDGYPAPDGSKVPNEYYVLKPA